MNLIRCHLLLGIAFAAVSSLTVAATMDWSAGVPLFALLIFLLLPLGPIALATVMGWLVRKARGALITSTVGLIAVFGFMAYLYVQAFYLHPDPQGGLIIIFGPIYSSFALIPFGIVAVLLAVRHQSQSTPAA